MVPCEGLQHCVAYVQDWGGGGEYNCQSTAKLFTVIKLTKVFHHEAKYIHIVTTEKQTIKKGADKEQNKVINYKVIVQV